MNQNELNELAGQIARYVIEKGEVEEGEWFISSLGAAVAFEADERGYENATEIAEEAVRLYS